MGRDEKESVDADSPEFTQGVEAGLDSEDDTRNWKAGNELGQELRVEADTPVPPYVSSLSSPPTPLFVRNSSERLKGTDQDEKDGIGE